MTQCRLKCHVIGGDRLGINIFVFWDVKQQPNKSILKNVYETGEICDI